MEINQTSSFSSTSTLSTFAGTTNKEKNRLVSETLNSVSLPTVNSSYQFIEEWVFRCAKSSPIREILKESPLQEATFLSESVENKIFIKREDISPVKSFKLRGAFTKISNLLEQAKQRGVYACSAGNHAQGVAFTARHYGLSSKIYMPVGAPQVKVNQVKRFGSEIVLNGETLDDCFAAALSSNETRLFIHPFDDIYVIGGCGTVALELINQLDLSTIDYLFCPCGGGGLIAGIGIILKKLYPHLKIIGVESYEAPGMATSLSNNCVTSLNQIGKFADGTAIKKIGDLNFKICKVVIDEMVLVTTSEICSAISDGFSDFRVMMEPSGALGIAGLRKFTQKYNIRNKNCITISTGSNIDFLLLRFVTELADVSERIISVLLPEHPGSFKSLFPLISIYEITGISYNQSKFNPTSNIIFSLRISSNEDKIKWMKSLKLKGYDPLEVCGDSFAQNHGKFFNCGPNISNKDLSFFRFEFFNSKKKLIIIFSELPESWDLSVIHYRYYGSEMCSLLIGAKLPLDPQKELDKFLSLIKNNDITVSDETSNPLLNRLLTFL